jgi:hypothetical protein
MLELDKASAMGTADLEPANTGVRAMEAALTWRRYSKS